MYFLAGSSMNNSKIKLLLCLSIGILLVSCTVTKNCDECKFFEDCKTCGDNEFCLINGDKKTCTKPKDDAVVKNCLRYLPTDKSSLKEDGLKCNKADEGKGFFQNVSKKPTDDCSECFDDENKKKPCDLCPEHYRCEKKPSSNENKATCKAIAEKKKIDKCLEYKKTDSKDEAPKCWKCEDYHGFDAHNNKCVDCCSNKCHYKKEKGGEGTAVEKIDGAWRNKCVKKKDSRALLESARKLGTKSTIVEIKESDRAAGCRKYKNVKEDKDGNESKLTCEKCFGDFKINDGECTMKCEEKKGEESDSCKYKNDYGVDKTNQFYCKLESKEEKGDSKSTAGDCTEVKKVDAECEFYAAGTGDEPKCKTCEEGNININNDCQRKCTKKSPNCDNKQFCSIVEGQKEGACTEGKIVSCKDWKDISDDEVCETCVDGFKLNTDKTKCNLAKKMRRLMLQYLTYGRIFDDY